MKIGPHCMSLSKSINTPLLSMTINIIASSGSEELKSQKISTWNTRNGAMLPIKAIALE